MRENITSSTANGENTKEGTDVGTLVRHLFLEKSYSKIRGMT